NGILISLGLPTLRWLGDKRIAMLCLVLPGLIMYGPGLIYIASLQSIPDEFYEAAELEGCTFWQKIWHITLPRLRPLISMMLILAVINNMQVFMQPFVMTGGGPGDATRSVVMFYYKLAFENMKFGKGQAVALVLFIILAVLVYLQRKYFKENPDV
ncbi:sugar ABC transporter permease, partial [Candidatus Aerophobetes bacterium]|nr:sugar ABC transporter permease [Candidatus Aerophobetes bacterium]